MLGFALQQTAPLGFDILSIYYPDRDLPISLPFPVRAADITDDRQISQAFDSVQPDVVIHTAAIGSVDFAETNKDQARKVNVGGTKMVIDLCLKFKSKLIYISSNAVFDGQSPFYSETASVNPINYYGKLKVEAERLVQGSKLTTAIVRPILLYGWPFPGERDNPVVWWVKSLEAGKTINVVDNVYSNPLPAWSCAQVIWAVIQKNRTGVYHAAGRDHVSLYQFALQTSTEFGLNPRLIQPVPDSFFPEIAPRPKDTSYDTTKMESELGIKPVGLQDGLSKMHAERSLGS